MTAPRRTRPARSLIVAAAGYGKSAALDSELPVGARRCTGAEALVADLSGVPAIGVDDVDELAPQQQAALLRRLSALPPQVGFVLTSRSPLDPSARRELRGELLERGPQDLRLSAHAVARVLAEEYAVLDPESAEKVYAATAGWPALVHLAADALVREPDRELAGSLARTGSATATWVAANVLVAVPEPVARTLSVVAGLGPVTQSVLARVASVLGVGSVGAAAAYLRQVGVLVPRRIVGLGEREFVVPAVARVIPPADVDPELAREAFRAAASAYEDEKLALAAARARAAAGDRDAMLRLVEEQGEQMLRQGDAREVVELLAERIGGDSSAGVRRTYADGLRLSGEPAAAMRAFQPLVAAADRDGWTPALASRVAAVHHTVGDYPAALATLERACSSEVPADNPADATVDEEHVEWLCFRVRAHAMTGRRDDAERLAAETAAVAERLATPRAAAAAHVALARVADGALKEAHHEKARRAAEECGDAVTVGLVLVNQAHLQLASARFAEAATSSREVVRIAELGFPPGRLVAALHNLAEALTRLGEYDEARWHLDRAVAHARRLGPGPTAVGLLGLAEIHRQLGHGEQAHSAYLEAVRLARLSQETQVLVPALAGLARMEAGGAPERASALAQEAHRLATCSLRPFAAIARGWVALARGDRAAATDAAAEAVETARQVQAVDLLAEALELKAECAVDGAVSAAALNEALAIWRSGGAVPAAARLEVLLGGIDGVDATARSRARDAARLLQRIGIMQVNGRPVTSPGSGRTISVNVLGGFTVCVDGAPVPLVAWRSRQARVLVKILAARRGRPVTRTYLCELLWPGDDPSKTGHRLSVLLATVRGVLDPGKRWPVDRYIASDVTGVWLDLRRARVDADDLVRDADQAAALIAAGEDERAGEILADVDSRYVGDAFEDEPYADWADGLREEARAAWMRSVRLLVSARNRAGRDAHTLLVRLLAADPYDEQAHRLLVRTLNRTGRHGEAQRAFDRWTDAMRAIDVPLPDPGLLRAVLTPR